MGVWRSHETPMLRGISMSAQRCIRGDSMTHAQECAPSGQKLERLSRHAKSWTAVGMASPLDPFGVGGCEASVTALAYTKKNSWMTGGVGGVQVAS